MTRRIALVSSSYHPYPGGVEEHVSNLARHLSRAGHEVVVWTVDRGEHLGVGDVDGVQVHYLPTPLPARDASALARFIARAPRAWSAWARAHRAFQPDLIHVHCFGPNGLYALALHRRYRTPLFVTSHGETFADDHGAFEQSALLRTALRSALRASAATTACSTLVATDLRSRFGAVTCDVVPNAIEPDEPGLEGGELPEGWPLGGTVVLAIGRVVPVKGFDLLVRAFAVAAQPGEHLVIAGDGPEGSSLEQLAADLGVSHRVHFPGRLERPAVVTVMAAADLVVVPSRVEAFGIVALEAWRAGTPLVMTSRGGAADFVVDGDNGLLVNPEDGVALARAIRSVLDDPALAQRLAAAGSEAVRAFTWDRVTRDYLDIYDRVLDASGAMTTDVRRPRVLVLDHTAELGGAELALVRLLDAIGDRADVTTALLSHGPLTDRLRDGGHRVEVIPMDGDVTNIRRHDLIQMLLSPLRLVPLVRRLARLARELDADLIHTTSLKADVIGLAVGVVARRPLVWHLHDRIAPDYLPRPLVTLLRTAARRVTRVIVNSAATAATVPGRGDLVIASPGLAPDQIRESPRPRPEGPPLIGLVGRISPTKDQLTFVRAAAQVRHTHPAARFVIVGRAAFGAQDYEQLVRAEVTSLGLDDAVTFAGFTDDVPAVLDGLTVCVHTASIPEPFGQAVIEAMGRGVPVIATSGGGVDEIFADATGHLLGWLVPPAAPVTLAAAITAALSDPEEAERRGRQAWESVRVRYPIARTADAILDVWQDISTR